jgi:peptidoglycan/LPS O-acetylase OafA/YrhL
MPQDVCVPGILLFCAGVVVSLAASWLLVSRLERLGERPGFPRRGWGWSQRWPLMPRRSPRR